MLMNNLDPDVAERPEDLVVYGGIGRAARNWRCFDKIVECLRHLEHDQTLLVQSGKPVGIFQTHPDAPRVLIANSNLVPHWATWEHFHQLDRKGLMMYGQMTAGSWIYIGSQGIVQGTYETFVSVGRSHFGGNLHGKWILTAGLGGMGGAQPLACDDGGRINVGGRVRSVADRNAHKDAIPRPVDGPSGTSHRVDPTILRANDPISVGLLGNAAEILPEMVEAGRSTRRGDGSDVRTRSVERLFTDGWTIEQAADSRRKDPESVIGDAKGSIAKHVRAMLEFQDRHSNI